MNVYETAEKLAKEIQNLDIYKTINETIKIKDVLKYEKWRQKSAWRNNLQN